MNAFEDVVTTLFKRDGYWTQINYKLGLKPEEKREIKNKTIPTIDVDLVAYRPGEIFWIECKSYLGSRGVGYNDLFGNGNWSSHYKLFTRKKYREVLLRALKNDLVSRKMAGRKDKIFLWLVAGKVAGGNSNEQRIKNGFEKKKWKFMGPDELRDKLKKIKLENIWDDNVTHVVTKLLVGD